MSARRPITLTGRIPRISTAMCLMPNLLCAIVIDTVEARRKASNSAPSLPQHITKCYSGSCRCAIRGCNGISEVSAFSALVRNDVVDRQITPAYACRNRLLPWHTYDGILPTTVILAQSQTSHASFISSFRTATPLTGRHPPRGKNSGSTGPRVKKLVCFNLSEELTASTNYKRMCLARIRQAARSKISDTGVIRLV